MSSVDDYTNLLQRLESAELQVRPLQCLRARNRNLECTRCADACLSGCISFEDGEIAIDPGKCVGCGSCATACPTDALYPRNPEGIDIAKAAKAAMERTEGTVVFTCATMMESVKDRIDPETVTPVTCLARLDESLLMVLVAAGAQRIRLVAGPCAECPLAKGWDVAEQVVAGAKALAAAWDSPAKIKLTDKFPRVCALEGSASFDYEKRESLMGLRNRAKQGGAEVADMFIERTFLRAAAEKPRYTHVEEDGTLPHYLPQRHALLADVLKTLGEPQDVSVKTRLWGQVSIDEDLCNGCQMCAVFCPTGALAKYVEPEEEGQAKSYKLYRAPSNPSYGAGEVKERRASKHHSKANASSSFTATGEVVTLVHAPSRCVSCGSCQALCPQQAIQLGDRVNARDLQRGYVAAMKLKDIYEEKGGPDAIRNSMKKLINSPYVWG